MPIYEYVCGKCRRKTEVIQRVGERKLKVCPHCGGKLTKAFSAPAIQFKGSGFYITDYARASQEGFKSSPGTDSKSEASDKSERTERSEKAEKAEKTEKAEKGEKKDKSAKPEKKEKKPSKE
jgi:putative FmdB family regulatory protein